MFEAIVVGGGPAGLSAALTLGRARRSTLLLDSGEYRNAPAAAVHNFLWGDGLPPAEVRRIGREALRQYPSVEVRDAAVLGAAPDGQDGFTLRLAGRDEVRTRRLVLATGLSDELPPIDGLAALWGRGAFHCPYCHGFEVRDTALAVLGAEPDRVRLALHLTRFSHDVVLCTNGPAELDAGTRGLLEAHGVVLRQERIARVEGANGHLERITFEGGGSLARQALFVRSRLRQRSELPAQLGCAILEDGAVAVDDLGRSSVPGVYAVGDMAHRADAPGFAAAVIVAAASGTLAAAVVDHDLLTADLHLPSPFAPRRVA